jgi:hypothetical protein
MDASAGAAMERAPRGPWAQEGAAATISSETASAERAMASTAPQ